MYVTAGLHRSLQRHPDKIATVHGNRRQSYRQLVDRVARTASVLRSSGLVAGDRLSVLSANSDKMMELMLAGWWCGLVVTPINTRWRPAEVAFALSDSAASALAVDDANLSMALELPGELPLLRIRIYIGESLAPSSLVPLENAICNSTTMEDVRSTSDSLAAIVYTGGTTGFSKGVMLSHGNFWAALMGRMINNPTSCDSVTLLTAPMFHVAGLGRMLAQIMAGGTSITLESFEPQRVTTLLAQECVTDLMVVPSMLQVLLETDGFESGKLPRLESIFWGAAPITPTLLKQALETFPGVEFLHTYGMTETAASISSLRVRRDPEFLSGERIRSIGLGGLSCEILIVDEQGLPVPARTPGEILVRGPSVMLGYWNCPDQTRQVMAEGWLHTGDVGFMDEEGYLFVIDRIKDMIISGGENIFPVEVENVLASHPAVAVCAVIGVPHKKWGEAVHAVVVLQASAHVSGEDLSAFCRTRLSSFKCPKSYEFRQHLPLTSAGKVQKTELRKSLFPSDLP